MNDNLLIDIEQWVSRNIEKPSKPFRHAVHTILHAITNSDYLTRTMIIKGGILLSIRYQSTRYTKDIDFSTSEKYTESQRQRLENELDKSLIESVEILNYGLECRLQSCRLQPANQPDPSYPSLKIKIGYAYKGTKEHKHLLKKEASNVIDIDFSYNEPLLHVEKINLSDEGTLLTYSLTDLIAEKFRALLQQEVRKRPSRRQDVYDLYYLFQSIPKFLQKDKKEILETLILKAQSRDLSVTKKSLSNPIIRERSKEDYGTIADEIVGELPDFDSAYSTILEFYESLPW